MVRPAHQHPPRSPSEAIEIPYIPWGRGVQISYSFGQYIPLQYSISGSVEAKPRFESAACGGGGWAGLYLPEIHLVGIEQSCNVGGRAFEAGCAQT